MLKFIKELLTGFVCLLGLVACIIGFVALVINWPWHVGGVLLFVFSWGIGHDFYKELNKHV